MTESLSELKIESIHARSIRSQVKAEATVAALRCKALYNLEKESRYFCNMEKNVGTLKYIPSLIIDGIEIKDQKQIENETFKYWKKLYQKQEVTQDIQDFLDANSEH